MKTLKYDSMTAYCEMEIDMETATLDEINDAYKSLSLQSWDDGAYPTSQAAKTARGYRMQLEALVAARPEIVTYRAGLVGGGK